MECYTGLRWLHFGTLKSLLCKFWTLVDEQYLGSLMSLVKERSIQAVISTKACCFMS
jgi:hypothetical protein